MTILTGRFATPNASKYLQQLCKHFAHKIQVDYSENHGSCDFELGIAHMTADDENLTIRFDLQGPEHIDKAKGVIDSHLVRFAFRENYTTMVWDG